MPLSNNEVDKFFQNKMSFERVDGNHSKYRFSQGLGVVMRGVLPPSIQHGRGEVPKHILKQIESFFGISSRALSEATDCHYSAMAIHLSFTLKHLDVYVGNYPSDPVSFEPLLLGFSRTVPVFVKTIRAQHDPNRKHRNDRGFKKELDDRLSKVVDKSAPLKSKSNVWPPVNAACAEIKGAIEELGG